MVISCIVIVVFVLKPKVMEAKTTVVLLNNGKRYNAVNVSNNKGSSYLDKVGAYVDMSDKKAPPKPKMMSKSEIDQRFAKALSAVPQKPISYLLYFQPHGMALTPASNNTLLLAIEMLKKRQHAMVDIIGHTDTIGSSKLNVVVSLKRAKYIKEIFKEKNLNLNALVAKGYGENDLQVATKDNVAEAKNRNVEIFIK